MQADAGSPRTGETTDGAGVRRIAYQEQRRRRDEDRGASAPGRWDDLGARSAQAGHDAVLVDVGRARVVEKSTRTGVTVVRGDEERARTGAGDGRRHRSGGGHRRLLHQVLPHFGRRPNRRVRSWAGARLCVAPKRLGQWGRARVVPAEQITVGVHASQQRPAPGSGARRAPGGAADVVGAFVDGNSSGAETLAHALNDASLDTTIARLSARDLRKLVLNAATLQPPR